MKWWDRMLWLFQNPTLQGGLDFCCCAGSVGGLPQLAAVISWPHLMLPGKRRPIFFGVQCFFFLFFFFNVVWDKHWVGRRRERGQRKHRAQRMIREDPWEDGGFQGSHIQGSPSNPSLSGYRASGQVRSWPQANSHQGWSKDHLWDKLFFLLPVLMWLSYFGQPFK